MLKLDAFEAVIQQLKLGEVVCVLSPHPTYFAYKDTWIHVQNEQTRYRLPLHEFQAMFQDEVFYLKHSVEQEGMDELKDQEYYAWRNKSQ